MKNNKYDTYHIKKVCQNKLKIKFHDGSELNGHIDESRFGSRKITIPHGRKFVPIRTYKSMAKQLGLTVDDFDRLLDCPLKYDEYLNIATKIFEM